MESITSTTPTHAGKWMTIEELATYIGQSKSAIYKLTCYRKIPFYRPGKKVLFKQSEIDEWIQSSRINTLAEVNQSVTFKTRTHENI